MIAKEALDILAQLAAQYKGTLKEHEVLQEALKTLKAYVEGHHAEK
jgi:hypothetical protein